MWKPRRVVLRFRKFPGWSAPSICNFRLFARGIPPSVAPPPPAPIPETTPIPEPEPEPEPKPRASDVVLDVGNDAPLRGTRVHKHTGELSMADVSGIPSKVFRTSREGRKFDLRIPAPPGTYDVELGFVETDECASGRRVFNVLMNGFARLNAFDIFHEAGGCHKAVVETFVDQAVGLLQPHFLHIELRGIAGEATLSFVRVRPVLEQCVPVTTHPKVRSDHLAHSVPGVYPQGDASSFVDRAGVGQVSVKLDGSGSHTHFSDAGKSGRIISYRWTLPETGKVVSRQASFRHSFPLGTTRLKLTVMDDACTRDEAETTVSVTGNMQPGAYCYYYDDLTSLPGPGTLLKSPLPKFAAVSPSLAKGFPSIPFRSSAFVARCIFSVEALKPLESTIVSVDTANTGAFRVYNGEDLIIDSSTASKSGPIVTVVGLTSFEILYQRTDLSRKPSFVFKVDDQVPRGVFHDQSTVMPIITSISPPSGRMEGGAKVKIEGFGLYIPLKVFFGSKFRFAYRKGATSKEIFAIPPPAARKMSVDVVVKSGRRLPSNAMKYSYTNDCDDVKFEKLEIKTSARKDIPLTQPTAISIWQDGKLYIGTRIGVVKVVSYDAETLTTKSICHSEQLTDSRYRDASGSLSERAILGITFDPQDIEPRPYVSVSTLSWKRHDKISHSNKKAWSNGAVERLKPSSAETRSRDPKQCLEHDRNIVRNLPVSNRDHGVNELLFTQDGDLLISVGGFTNMGLPNARLGGIWEAFFSGAVLIAKLSKGASFNGNIPYSNPTNLRTAFPKAGYTDVRLYATGLRNLFSMTMTRSGRIYGLDMGPNCDFGDAASSCTEYNETIAAEKDASKVSSYTGSANVPNGKLPCDRSGSGHRGDKLLELKEGKFYGHANLQRAAQTQGFEECHWIDPYTQRRPSVLHDSETRRYEAPLAMVTSAKTGIREYGGQNFCGKMRGDLILSQMGGRGVWRAHLLPDGRVDGSVSLFQGRFGGLRVEETVRGDLVYAQYNGHEFKGLSVSRAVGSPRDGLFVRNALPFRHGRRGGGRLVVGGSGFEEGASVLVGNGDCAVIHLSGSEIVCRVPPKGGGGNAVSVTVSLNGVSSQLSKAVLYMNV